MNQANGCGDRRVGSSRSGSVLGARRRIGDADEADAATVTLDCDSCVVRGPACHDCVVSVLLGLPPDLQEDERAALDVLTEAGLMPRLRCVSVEPTAGRENPGAA